MIGRHGRRRECEAWGGIGTYLLISLRKFLSDSSLTVRLGLVLAWCVNIARALTAGTEAARDSSREELRREHLKKRKKYARGKRTNRWKRSVCHLHSLRRHVASKWSAKEILALRHLCTSTSQLLVLCFLILLTHSPLVLRASQRRTFRPIMHAQPTASITVPGRRQEVNSSGNGASRTASADREDEVTAGRSSRAQRRLR